MGDDRQLQIGIGEIDITPAPPRDDPEAFKVFDRIAFRAIVMRRGGENFALLTGDFFSFEGAMMDMVREHIGDIAWLNPNHIVASVSHCGGVPILFPSYVSQPCPHLREFGGEARYAEVAASAIRIAVNDLRPARIGMGHAVAAEMNYNRRSYDGDGKLVMSNFMLPYPRPELTYAQVDPNVYVLRVDGLQAPDLRAVLMAFGCHALCNNDKQGHISSDYPGVARRVVQAYRDVPVAFAPGAIGDAVPLYRGGDAYLRIGEGVGRATIAALETTRTCADAPFEVHIKTVCVPRLAKMSPEEAERALPAVSDGHDGNQRFNSYSARKTAVAPEMPYTLTAVRIGDGMLLHLPGEVFVETAAAIRRHSRARPLAILSGPSADIGYLCPPRAHEEGGMEPKFAALSGEAETIIRQAAIGLMEQIDGQL